MMDSGRRKVLIGALIAIVAQMVIAPNIALFGVMPNFIVVYVIVVSMFWPADSLYVPVFVLGLVSDLLGFGPVGITSLLLLVASFAVSRAFEALDNSTIFIPVVLLVVSLVAIEVVYGAVLAGLGIASVLDAMVFRAFPSAFYDCIVGVVFYFIAVRILGSGKPRTPVTGMHFR